MIAYIEGKIAQKNPAFVIVENGGMGFKLNISLNTYGAIQSSDTCKLFTYLNIKNDGQSLAAFELFGFATELEREVFEQLVSVSGIGANTARMMLSSLTPQEVSTAIAQENVEVIKSVKGIGPKTAKRAILELKDKMLKNMDADVSSPVIHNTAKDEALSALVSLGFNRNVAEKAVMKALSKNEGDASVEVLIKESLKQL